MPKPYEISAEEAAVKIRTQELTAEEYVASVFNRITQIEKRINAFITLTKQTALQTARQIDEKIRKGEKLGCLAGIPIAVKDNICTRGVRTTCSSRMLKDFVPPYDATVIEKLINQDAVIIGKTNMDEFAMGTTTETSYFGATHNPWNLKKVPGGSSGGSAAAVTAEETPLALGSDTGGSVRCPASYCSTVGLKPTYGLVSRYGLISYANSLEQIGPLARNVYDCALLLSVISGHDARDSTSVNMPPSDYTAFLKNDVKGLKIGVPQEFLGEGVEDAVKKAVWDAVNLLETLGAEYEEVTVPTMRHALPAYYIVAMSEASSNLARYDGLRYGFRVKKDDGDWSTIYAEDRRAGFGTEVRRRIILGTYALSAGYYDEYYLKALRVRTLIRRDFEKALKKCDVLVGPTMPILPFNLGEKIDDPLALYMCDVLTVPANLTGYPAASIPCGFKNGLPIGLQIIGKPFDEGTILRVAYTFERNTDFHKRRPIL
ncbi:Asp-tRNA(Asn)/Glu-tRNA(Gln) amidotransferase GatCAB subunit A [Candidatus Bathyarchaeota archaeon ex4484_231]|nr:MAG: Asp-tRNA(Asn)/Glu-tRNA(Gln) amidotransferase GatCAB subunit A [Candidatus Bathyarchaeota archaeon ex4484_231]